MQKLKIAAIQWAPQLGQVESNLKAILALLDQAIVKGAELIVFPECSITGYNFASKKEAMDVAISSKAFEVKSIQERCKHHNCYVLLGTLEKENHQLFNSVFCYGPQGFIGAYRKVHLPHMGADLFVDHSPNSFGIFEIKEVKVGVLICYDLNFPEAARCLGLQGCDLIVVPTNWPEGCSFLTDKLLPTRAFENHVYLMAINRIKSEGIFNFIGKSTLCHPSGKILFQASRSEEEILIAEIDPSLSRQKQLRFIPEKYELNFFSDRKVHHYKILLES